MPSKLDPHLAMIESWLAVEPQLTALGIVRRLAEIDPATFGCKQHSIVQRLLRALRRKAAETVIATTATPPSPAVALRPGPVDGAACDGHSARPQALPHRSARAPDPTSPVTFPGEAIRGVSSPFSSASVFREQRDDENNRQRGADDVALPASSPSSPAPAARRYAALGLDRSARPSKLADRAADATCSMCGNENSTCTENLLHKTSDTPSAHFIDTDVF